MIGPISKEQAAEMFHDNYTYAVESLNLRPIGVLHLKNSDKYYFMQEPGIDGWRSDILSFEYYFRNNACSYRGFSEESHKKTTAAFKDLGRFVAKIEKMGFRIDLSQLTSFSIGCRNPYSTEENRWVLDDKSLLSRDLSHEQPYKVFLSLIKNRIEYFKKHGYDSDVGTGIVYPNTESIILDAFNSGYQNYSLPKIHKIQIGLPGDSAGLSL